METAAIKQLSPGRSKGGQPTATLPLYPNGNGKSTEKKPQNTSN